MIDFLRHSFLPAAAMFFLGAIAGAGLIPLIPLGNDEPLSPESATTSSTTTSTPTTEVVAVEGTTSLPGLPGVDAAVSRVLAEEGFASRMSREELGAEIDQDIIEVLEQADAVVTVVEDRPEEQSP